MRRGGNINLGRRPIRAHQAIHALFKLGSIYFSSVSDVLLVWVRVRFGEVNVRVAIRDRLDGLAHLLYLV